MLPCRAAYNKSVYASKPARSGSYLGVSCWSVYVCRDLSSVPRSRSAGIATVCAYTTGLLMWKRCRRVASDVKLKVYMYLGWFHNFMPSWSQLCAHSLNHQQQMRHRYPSTSSLYHRESHLPCHVSEYECRLSAYSIRDDEARVVYHSSQTLKAEPHRIRQQSERRTKMRHALNACMI